MTPNPPPAGTVGVAYSQQFSVSGGTAPYHFTVSASPAAGLTLSGSGLLSGTPTIAGSYPFTVNVTDSSSPVRSDFTQVHLTINTTGSGGGSLAISTTSLPDGTLNTAYDQPLTATGGNTPYTWSLVSGSFPVGLGLTSAGHITGTPTVASSTPVTFTIRVSDGISNVTKSLSITIDSTVSVQRAGVLSQVASGGGWKSSIYLTNLTSTAQTVTLNFYADDGSALTLPLSVNGITVNPAASLTGQSIAANSTLLIESTSTALTDTHGWAEVLSTGSISGYEAFHYTAPGANGAQSEGTVPLESTFASSFVLPYENENQFAASVALVNLNPNAAITLTAAAYNANGQQLAIQPITIPKNGHKSALLTDLIPNTTSFRGFVEFTNTTGNITGLGLRVSPQGGFTSTPKMARPTGQ